LTIIALTTYAMAGDERRAIAAGCHGYIAKPIDTRSLSLPVRDALGRREGPAGRRAER